MPFFRGRTLAYAENSTDVKDEHERKRVKMIEFNGRKYFDPEESRFWKKFLEKMDDAYGFKGTKVNQSNLDRFNALSGAAQILADRAKDQNIRFVPHAPDNFTDFASVELIRDGSGEAAAAEIAFDEQTIPLFLEVLKLADFVSITADENFNGSVFTTIALIVDHVFEK